MRKIGDKMCFSGGAEETPHVEVVKWIDHLSLHDGDPTFKITQGEGAGMQSVILSPETLKEILRWYEEGQ
jgi:hypothetical protein